MSTRGDRKTGKKISVANQAGSKVKATAKRSLFNCVEKIVQNVGTKISSCVDSLAGGLRLAATPSFEALESRQLLSAVSLTVGQFTLYDSTGAGLNDVNVAALASGTTGGVTAVVTTVQNGIGVGDDSVSSIVVTGPGTGAAVTVNLFVTGPVSGPVTYVGAGDTVTFNYFNEAANDAAGGGFIPVGATSGFTTTAVVANGDTANAVADDDDLTADGALNSAGAAVTLTNAVVGGTIRNTVGSIGTIALGGGTLTSSLLIETDSAASNTTGVTITGAVTLGAFSITAHTAEGAATGGTVSIASGATITIAGAGGITINSDETGNGSAGVLGNTILGNLSIAAGASGDISIASDGGNANMGALTIGTVTNASTGGSSITADASGTGTIGAVSIDAVTMTGNSATNDIAIGSANSTVASITLNGISNGDADNGADVTFNANNLTGALALGAAAYVADNGGSIAVTVAGNLGSITGTGSLSVTNDDAGGGIAISDAGTAGAVAFGAITNNNTAAQAITLAFDSNGTGTEATASFTTGAININDLDAGGIANTVQTGNVTITFGSGVTGALTLGAVSVGDSGDADTADFSLTATANNTGFGAVTTGTLSTDGTGGSTITVDNNGTGSMASVSLGAVAIGGTGDNHITFGHLGGATATTNLGIVTLAGLTNTNNNTNSDLTIQAADFGNVVIAGVWSLTSAGDVNITALAGVGAADAGIIGTVGGNTWDVNFSNALGPVINIFGADGIGAITAGSVDFLDATIAGNGFNINANSDADDTGPVGDITVRNAGDDATNSTSFIGSVTATDGANVSVAGGISTSTFDSTSGTLDTGDWGNFAIGIDVASAAVANSDSPSLTINSDDGVGTIILSGLNSQLTASSVQANVDADAVGSVGNVSVSGEAGANSLTSGATWNAVDFGNFALTDGNFNISLDNNITLAVDRIATTSNVGTITVTDGAITGGTLTIDDGIGAISVNNLTPINGTATFVTITTDADAGDAGAAIGGGIGTITTTGTLFITTLNTNGVGDTTNRASENAGAILAGSDLTITTLNIGGSIPSITIVETAPVGARVITIGTLTVSGDLDTITSGLGAGDDITITNASTIFGDLDRINAGAGNVAIANGLRVAAGTHTSPVYVVTDTGVDYIFDVAGTWNAGGNAASVDATITFAGGNANSVNIADLEGTTSATDTDLILATRLNATGAVVNYSANLGPDTSTALYNLSGFQDDYSTIAPLQDGRHSFRLIEIEGNLNGAIGADANASDGSANTIAGTAAILGTIRNLEIIGNWNNGAAPIKVLAVDELSFGSLTTDRIAATGAVKEFSFDSPSGVGGDGVLPPGGNSNGTSEDLEVYTALAGTSQTNIVVPLPDGGSLTKSVVGPTGAFETIRLTDNGADGIIDTVVLTFGSGGAAGKLRILDLFGENIGFEYNAVDPSNPMTDSLTNINYGIARNDLGLAATNVSAAGQNAIDYLETSGGLGIITVVDADVVATVANEAIDQVPVGVGNISAGYVVTLDGASDVTTNGGVASYINDPNDGTGNGSTLALVAGVPVYAGIGNISVDGPLGGVVSSGDVGTITTNDTVDETLVAAAPAGTATFAGLVTDGSVGAITINGTVGGSLVVGDPTVTSTGADLAFGGAGLNADTIGITGAVSTARFLGAITVHNGNLGTTEGSVAPTGGNAQLPLITGDEVSAPYGIAVAILVDLPTGLTADPGTGAGQLRATVVSGKHTLVDPATGAPSQSSDDITGNITAVDIVGDIWSGDDIAANITATGITAFLSGTTAVTVGDAARGNITSQGANAVLNISATGASAGDITANVLADGNLNNIFVDAGIGTGGSINANIIGGTDGTGGFTGTNTLNADQNIGLADNSNVVSAADDIVFGTVAAGLQTSVDPLTPADVVDGGNVNVDFSAGIPVGQTVPVGAPGSAFTTGIADANLPTFQSDDDTITITTLDAGNVAYATDLDASALDELDSNLNGTLAAASSITVTTTHIDGNAVGNNGTAGGHVAAAGLGWLGSGTPFAAGTANHAILTLGTGGGSTIVGDLTGTVSGGLFVPFNNTNNSPLNANDLASLQSGTVLTLGEVVLGAPGTLSVGRWLQDGTGVNGGEAGISLTELREGTESGANVAFAPTTSVGSTHNASVNVAVVGRPFAAPQTGPGTVTPNPADGDGTNISILSFGSVTGTSTFADSASFNFIISNADAITAIDTAGNGNPSSPSTNGRFNSSTASGAIGTDITLNVTASGNGAGGLTIGGLLAGYDYFSIQAGGPATNAPAGSTATTGVSGTGSANNALRAFGVGSITPSGTGYHANDGDPTDGLEAGDFTFGLIGAGNSISGTFAAQDDLTATILNDFINGVNVGITGATRASVAAGLSANAAMDGLGIASLFVGGNNAGKFVAGDDVAGPNNGTMLFTAQGSSTNAAAGNFTALFAVVSGAEDQFADATSSSNLNAILIASGSFAAGATIDAGDTQLAFGATTGGGLGGASGTNVGSFAGGIIAGAGPDLLIANTADNNLGADMNATIRTVGNLDVTGIGILAEDNMAAALIEVGYGPNGGNLLGNVVAEGTINEIEVFGNIGTSLAPSLIYTGDLVNKLGIGDAASIVGAGFNSVRPASAYISSFGTLNGSIFEGGDADGGGSSATTANEGSSIFVGGSIPTGSNISVGSQWGANFLSVEVHGNVSNFLFTTGEGAFFVTGGAVNSVDVIATDGDNTGNAGGGIAMAVNSAGTGPFAGIRNFIAGDSVASLAVTGGGVVSVVVNDDFAIATTIAAQLTALAINPSQFTFLTNSLPTASDIIVNFNNDVALSSLAALTVENDIGDNTNIGVGMNVAMTNVAINVQGNSTGAITSTRGSIGNTLIGGGLTAGGGNTVTARNSIGDVFVTLGDVDGNDTFFAQTGSIGVISTQDHIDDPTIDAATNLGGLIARTGDLFATVGVHGSIGLLLASGDITGTFTAETGDIGVDLDTTDKFTLGDSSSALPAGIFSDIGNIDIRVLAGRDIGNVKANLGSIISDVDADDITYTTTGTASIDLTDSSGTTAVVTNVHGSGSVVIHAHNSEEDDSILRAGRNLGTVSAFKDIGVYVFQAGGNIGDIIAQIGTVGATVSHAYALPGLDGLSDFLTDIGMGTLTITAGGNVGNITGGTGVGAASPASFNLNGVNVSFDSGGVFVTSTGGSVGQIEAKTGNVGAAGNPLVVRANGGISIDLATLQIAARPVNGRAGVGNVFSDIGSIWLDLVTGGDVGVSGATVIGGIAAPLGSITGSVTVGGDIGGIAAGQAINVTSNILGKSGIFRNPAGGSATLSSGSALNIDANGVTYVVLASNASGSVNYHVSGHNVIFDTITLTQGTGGGAGIQITNSSEGADPDAQAHVKLLNITGNASNITVDGSVDRFNVSGNLTDGSVIITGNGGDGHVHGNIGNPGNADGNAFAADGLSVQVGQGFNSLKADARNFGLVNATIANGSYISFANSLRLATGQGDGFITAYLGSGKATLSINNGYIESITFVGGAASDLVVLTNPGSLEANFSDAKATAKGVSTKIDNLLAAQSGLVASGEGNTGNLYNRIFEPPVILNSSVPGGALGLVDSTSGVGTNNTANVGRIVSGGSSVQLTNVIVEGNVKSVNLGYNGSVKNLVTAGNLGSVFAGKAQGVDVRGNAGTIDGAKNVSNVKVAGNADVIKSSGAISNVSVAGNAGVISAGAKLSRTAVGGSAITINGAILENVNVAGSVGLQVSGAAAGSLGLGAAFSAADAARILGSDDLASIGNAGPNGSLFLGGISGRSNNVRVAVGGLISDLILSKDSNALSNLLGQTVDDAFVGVDKTNAFVKKDGVLIKFPSGTSPVVVQELSQAAAPDDSRI
jgi:hypothetical protein